MLWCLLSVALSSALLSLAAVLARMPRINRRQIRLSRMMRGCIAIPFLLVAIGAVGIILILRYGGP
jgi:ABC-type spermidine/putrescine transport system permease subunit II